MATEDLFTSIHKGLRSMLYGLSERMQTNDFADLAATQTLVRDLEADFALARSAGCVLCILSHHAQDEDSVIFSQTAAVAPELTASLIEEHHALARHEAGIARSAHQLLATEAPEGRVAAGVALNADANLLFAEYLTHMNREDRELVPRMQQHYTDAQMVAMRSTIMSRLPPDRMFAILTFMLPSLNVTELSGLLASVRPNMPPPAFQAIVDLCAAKVDPARWGEAKLRIGL